jgi:hypothetical protein
MSKANKRTLGIVLAILAVGTVATVASADSCKNVDIVLDNQSAVRVKALYANFRCEGENERKEMFANKEVPPTTKLPVATQQDLQGCKGKKMEYVEVHYKVLCGDGKWSPEKAVKDSTFLNAFCSSDAGKQYVVQLLATDPQATCN